MIFLLNLLQIEKHIFVVSTVALYFDLLPFNWIFPGYSLLIFYCSMVYDQLLTFYLIPLKQMSMTVQVIPVRTTAPVQTEWTDSTAAVHQDLMEPNARQVNLGNSLIESIFRSNYYYH